MKLYFFKHDYDDEIVIKADKGWDKIYHVLLGEIEIQEPKKTVVKEVPMFQGGACSITEAWTKGYSVNLPPNAKNVKCTYEVEE